MFHLGGATKHPIIQTSFSWEGGANQEPPVLTLVCEEVLKPQVLSGDPQEDQGRLQGTTYHLQGQGEGTTTFIGLSVATPSSLEPSGGSEGGAALVNSLGRRGRG